MFALKTLSGLVAACALAAAATTTTAKPYKGAEIYSSETVKYGRFVMRMKMAQGSGLLSTFFLYKDGSEIPGSFWEEIDIEVLGKNSAYQMQSNIIIGQPVRTTEGLHTANQSLADDYHTYVLEWTPDYVAWYLDGQEVRRINGGNFVTPLTSAQSMRFNIWASTSEPWVGAFNPSILPAYQFVNYMEYHAYNPATRSFNLSWRDDFNSFNTQRWNKADWTFDGNYVDFHPSNVVVKDGTLVLAFTHEGQTGFNGAVPVDRGGATSSSSQAPSSSAVSSIVLPPSSSSVPRSSSVAPSSSSAPAAVGGNECNWYGTRYPLCATTASGWGWEDSKSCISRSTCQTQPAPFGVVGGASNPPNSAPVSSAPAPAPVPTPTPSSAPSSVSVSSSAPAPTPTPTQGLTCSVKVANNWGNGYQLDVTVNNGASNSVNGWNVTLSFAENPMRTGGWNANFSGSGNQVNASNVGWNGSIPARGSVMFGLQGNHDGSFVTPTCRVN
jgi:beta-glucanase (GH16 family)